MATCPTAWAPPTGLDIELTEAGTHWEAVRVPAYLGDRVLARLGDVCGAVIRDTYSHQLYFLIRPGIADSWDMPEAACVHVLGAGCWVAVPPRDRTLSEGLHWARPPDEGRLLTRAAALHLSLAAAVADALGPPGDERVTGSGTARGGWWSWHRGSALDVAPDSLKAAVAEPQERAAAPEEET